MGKHSVTTTAATTQGAHPWRATLRTTFAVGLASFGTVGAILQLVNDALVIVIDGYGTLLPDEIKAWLLGAAGFITATTAVITRIMSLKKVIELTEAKAPLMAPAPTPTK